MLGCLQSLLVELLFVVKLEPTNGVLGNIINNYLSGVILTHLRLKFISDVIRSADIVTCIKPLL